MRRGWTAQIEYLEDDYRNISGAYDAFVSVGMLEHVGVENYRELGRVARSVLGGNGRGLIHSIGRNHPAQLHPWIEQRIFPGRLPAGLERDDADLRALGSLGARCRESAPALRAARCATGSPAIRSGDVDRVRGMFDDKFVRMWRLYLAGSVAAFTTGTLQLFQVLFATAENNDVPLTRDHLYQPLA